MTRRDRTAISAPVVLPRPTDQYDYSYMNNLIKQLQAALDDARSPSVIRGGELFISNLPSRGAGLPSGSVFEDSGVLKVVRVSDAFADTYIVGSQLGTVTVTT